jgi:CRP-like cAMP-binding protein
MDQKLTALSNVPLFAGCVTKEMTVIGRLADEVSVPAGKVLAKEGSSAHEFFVIVEGSIDISKKGKVVRTLGPGDFFGELAMLGKVPRTATATAATPTRLLVLGHREFTTLLADHPGIQQKVLRTVAGWVAASAPDRAT